MVYICITQNFCTDVAEYIMCKDKIQDCASCKYYISSKNDFTTNIQKGKLSQKGNILTRSNLHINTDI